MKRVSHKVNHHLFNGPAENALARDGSQTPVKLSGDSDIEVVCGHSCGPSS